jgi:hypothetical protein
MTERETKKSIAQKHREKPKKSIAQGHIEPLVRGTGGERGSQI